MAVLPPTSARNEFSTLMGFIDSGIEHCRAGRWDKGVEYLRYVAAREPRGLSEAGLFLSYLGCAVARTGARTSEGLALCEQAVQVEFYQPENYVNLARTHLLAGRRLSALRAVEQGLRVDPEDQRLHELLHRIQLRRTPVLPFLARSNPINKYVGMIRHRLSE